ncbi:MAG: uracil-DNA glycosylase [Candidatus Woesearchaeota archaeon]|nr:uracil-DNA glycosylase [Candidatus Woesearchaeota archaeon]
MDKISALEKLKQEIENDKNLPLKSNLVFGEGSSDSEVIFIGEAPGATEDEQKRPFVGRSGQLLRRLICELGWKEENVYITNIVKRRPPENRDPLPKEIEKYKPYLTSQIKIINPKVIVPLGRFSMNYFLPNAKITRDQGKLFKVADWFVAPMFHPAAALRAPAMMKEFQKNFKKLPAMLKKIKETNNGN